MTLEDQKMDSSLVSQEAKKKSSRKQVGREWSRQDTLIFQTFGMTRREWRELPTHERKLSAWRGWLQQEEPDTIKPNRTPGYVYVLRHPRYADLSKVGETVRPTDRLRAYNNACPYKVSLPLHVPLRRHA